MDRRELQELLAKCAILGNSSAHFTVGIVVPTYTEAKQFTKNFNQLLDELPEWIKPEYYRNTTREIDFGTHLHIIMMYNENCSKGRTVDILYASSRMSDEDLAPHCFTVLHSPGSLIRFVDE